MSREKEEKETCNFQKKHKLFYYQTINNLKVKAPAFHFIFPAVFIHY